jgi:hypothetical protein
MIGSHEIFSFPIFVNAATQSAQRVGIETYSKICGGELRFSLKVKRRIRRPVLSKMSANPWPGPATSSRLASGARSQAGRWPVDVRAVSEFKALVVTSGATGAALIKKAATNVMKVVLKACMTFLFAGDAESSRDRCRRCLVGWNLHD